MPMTPTRKWDAVSPLARKHPLPPASLADMAVGRAGCAFVIAQSDSRSAYWSVVVGTNQGLGQDYRSEEAALEAADELLRRAEGPAHAALLAEAGLDAGTWGLGDRDGMPVFETRIAGMRGTVALRPRPDGLYDLAVEGSVLAEAADKLVCLMTVERERERVHARRRNPAIEDLMEDREGDLRSRRTLSRLQVVARRAPVGSDPFSTRAQATRPGMSRNVFDLGTVDGTVVDTLCVPEAMGRELGVGDEVVVTYRLVQGAPGNAEWQPLRVEHAPEPEPTIAP